MTTQLAEIFYNFVTLLAMVNPVEAAAAFATLTADRSSKERAAVALRSTLIAAGILLAFSYAGEALLRAIGVSLPAFKIAGGLLLIRVGFGMVFNEKSTQPAKQDAQAPSQAADPSVFPLAIPIITGPGALTAGVTLLSHVHEHRVIMDGAFIVIILVVFLITYVSMRSSEFITKWLGPIGIDATGRLVGIIITAIAVQMAVNGIYGLLQASPIVAH